MENLEKLNGVGKTTADKLKKAGYNTIEAIAMATSANLAKEIGVFPAVAKRIINSAKKITKERIMVVKASSKLKGKREVEEEKEEEKKKEKKETSKEEQRVKIALSETFIPVLAETLKENGDLFKAVAGELAKKAARYIKETAEFKEKVLNATLKNENFRQRLVTRIAKNLGDD